MNKKKITLLLIATLAIFVLTGVVIVTSVKLKQLATVPVTPNAPASQPMAAGEACGGTAQKTCSDSTEHCVYANGSTTAPYVNASGVCESSENAPNCLISFTVAGPTPAPTPTPSPSATPSPACRTKCTSDTDCPSGLTCDSNTSECRNPSCTDQETCTCPTPGPTSQPTPGPGCNSDCNPNVADTGCPSGETCEPIARKCRNPQCTDKDNCTCDINWCNTDCNPNTGSNPCGSGLTCEPISRKCRLGACTGQENCICATPGPTTTTTTTTTSVQPTPYPTTLPKSGDVTPTVMFVGAGSVLVILGVALATML